MVPLALRTPGKFVLADPSTLPALESAGQVILRYVDASARPTQDYPANPNGSPGAVADHHHFVEDVVFSECAQGKQLVVGVVFNQQNHLLIHGWFPCRG